MNNEIKEILAYFEEYVKTTDMHDSEPMLNWKDLKIVLDYITNLQQENERLKENAIHNDKVVDKAKWNEMIYKSRIEKAIDYITTEQLYTNYQWGKSQYVKILKDLLNILQGVGKDEN